MLEREPADWMSSLREVKVDFRAFSGSNRGVGGAALPELGKTEQIRVEETRLHSGPFEIEMPVRCSTEMSSKTVKETGLKFWGQFGVESNVEITVWGAGSREDSGCETGKLGLPGIETDHCPLCDSRGL